MKRVIVDDEKIVGCNSKDCDFTDFEIERKAYSFEEIGILCDKIREAFEDHMKYIFKNTTGITKVEVEFITYTKNTYGERVCVYNIKGTRYALAVLSLDCEHFIAFDEKIEDRVSTIREKYKDNGWYRIVARIPYKKYKNIYRSYVNSERILSILRKWNIPSSAAWVRFEEGTDEDKKTSFPFISDDECLMFVSGTIIGLGIVAWFSGGDKLTANRSSYLNVYDRLFDRIESMYPDYSNLSKEIKYHFDQ